MNPITNATRVLPWFANHPVIMKAQLNVRYNASFEGTLINFSIV